MSDFNKSYRIRTEIGKDTSLHVKLDRDYDVLELMSLKINQTNAYKFHTSEYGVIAGRVLANDAFGIPNAKISVFINVDNTDINDVVKTVLYPYNRTSSKDKNNIRYNLLPNEQVNNCHTIIGTFPEKQYMLDNDDVLEVFDKYYKYTTRTNNAGDYMIFGVPVGSQTLHTDIDLSDIGILSQKPRDMIYKGYNIEQFENPNKFKHSTNLESLTQVISQDNITDVIPFWGDEDEGTIGITRCDINVQYKFEPTCVFMGSVVSDTASNGISKKCIPTPGMGAMDEITTGSGTIEMIRKTPSGQVEEFQIKGTQLINGDGVWCYQIPMNLDYMMTDEFGNMVPTNDSNKGIPTRTRVRFRISMQDFDSDSINMFRCKMLVPHNPDIYSDNCKAELDYDFGDNTKESSYRDLFWNCVYSVKSYIPRIQRGTNWRNEKFTGFKRVNYYNDKNPIPYNNIRIRIPFMYMILCVIIKAIINVTSLINRTLISLAFGLMPSGDGFFNENSRPSLLSLSGELCNEDLEHVCFIPGVTFNNKEDFEINGTKPGDNFYTAKKTFLAYTVLKFYQKVTGENKFYDIFSDGEMGKNDTDEKSIDIGNTTDDLYRAEKVQGNNDYQYHIYGIRVTNNMNYLIQCIEMNLAREFKVIQFDFYNDWINGLIYIPRWARKVKRKIRFLGINISKGGKIKACNENFSSNRRNIVQQCGLKYRLDNNSVIDTPIGCDKNKSKCHKSKEVRLKYPILKNSGIVTTKETIRQQYVYYFKPYDRDIYDDDGKNVRLFSTDIILLGSMDDCNKWGIPNILKEMVSSTYQMPPNLALTDSELEGTEYETERIDHNLPLSNNKHRIEVGFNEHYRCLYFYLDNCYRGMSPFDEIGDYTEISGINWNYNGPLQNVRKNTKPNKLYTPGGHFLGISCTNPETTIKTCVNLSRICEYGTPMSQRETINVPEMSNGVLNVKYLSTVPTGFISNSDINDGEFRRVFSTLNSNRLRTIKDKKTNYLKYDFIHLNPIGFGGELYDRIMYNYDNNDTAKNFNRFITNNVIERNFEFDDDNNFYYREIKNEQINVSETQIMRTNENRDDEYYKFRFGYTENNLKFINFDNDDIKNRRYLYNNLEGDNNRKSNSFPMYNNSFYFYFGLHDGRTALDEFKKNYYAVCEKYALKYIEDNTDDQENYLTIEALENNLSVKFSNNCLYSINCVSWNELSANTNTVTVNIGEKLYFKATGLTPTSNAGIGTFTVNKQFNLSGNCMSMLFGDEAESNLNLTGKKYAFRKLFNNCTTLKSVSKNFLPATTLANNCYNSMFNGCSNLTTAPELPATTLAGGCYGYMFSRCSSLEVAPELPAKNMVNSCYSNMFRDCNRLTDVPEILGETIAKNCYEYMFNNCTSMIKGPSKLLGDVLFDNCYQFMFAGCTSLTTAPELPATTLANSCYESMFVGCTSLTTAPELPATTLTPGCYTSMFQNCTSLVTVPELPATTLATGCYQYMFKDCTGLTTAPELPATKLDYWCYYSMFAGCTSLTTAPELPAKTLELTCYDYMFTGCASLNYIKALFTTTELYNEEYEEYSYTTDWVKGVAPTGVFVKNINAAWNEIGDNGIPTGWNMEYYGELDYLTIECLEYCYIGFSPHADIEYRTYESNDEWIPLPSTERGFFEGKYQFRRRDIYKPNSINRFSIIGKCNLLGSVMSVLYKGDEFKGKNDIIENGYSLKMLFYNCKDIVSVSPTFLPATTLTEGCYSSMFAGCTSLTTAPELPATTLTNSCYESMFRGCISLTTAPELSAKKLVDSCYSNVFRDCIELNKITMLAEEGDSNLCLYNWVKSQYQMSDNGTFIKSKKLNLEIGVNGIPDGWNVIEID